MQWGLLAGIGKGLSQGADIVSRGMAEDRAVAREQARFDESRRWQQAMENKRMAERAEDKAEREANRKADEAYRRDQSAKQDSQFNQTHLLNRQRAIENNLRSVIDQQSKDENAVVKRYEKLAADMGGATKELDQQMQAEIAAIRTDYKGRITSMVNSYGEDQLKGTGFEYLLNPVQTEQTTVPKAEQTTQPDRSAVLSDYVKKWNISKSQQQAKPGAPAITNIDPKKSALMPSTGLNKGLLGIGMDDVTEQEFGQFANWMNKG